MVILLTSGLLTIGFLILTLIRLEIPRWLTTLFRTPVTTTFRTIGNLHREELTITRIDYLEIERRFIVL